MNNKEKQNLAIIFEYACVILVIFISLFLSSSAFAKALDNKTSDKVSESVGRVVKATSQSPTKSSIDKLKRNASTSDKKNSEQLNKAGSSLISTKERDQSNAVSAQASYAFSIHNAESYLVTDIDQDGYYQEFGVRFDADTEYGAADVYAEMYLSLDGGPWQHYYSSDVFTIYGDSLDDQYEVVSTLVEGYPPGSYDVLIDLYEVGVEGIVASYSSDDSSSLYGLPLEDNTYDVAEVVVIIEDSDHGGTSSMAFILLLMLTVLMRQLSTKKLAVK